MYYHHFIVKMHWYKVISVLCLFIVVVTCRKGQDDDDAQDHSKNYTVTEEVFFDFEIKDYDGPGEDYRGRVVMGMFGDMTPMTCMNFIAICKGFKRGRDKLHYKNSLVHRIVQDFMIQMGDVIAGDGSGSRSIYGDKFVDENFHLSHRAAGYVSMANHGKDTNGSQFFIMLNRARWLDGLHVVFGKVVKGMDVVRTIGDVAVVKGTSDPKKRVRVVDSGVLGLDEKYTLTDEQANSNEDIFADAEDEE